jgi:hypothetical protein
VPYYDFLWLEDAIEHIAERGISCDDFEHVAQSSTRRGRSRSSKLPAAWGYTPDGRYIMAVFEQIDDLTLRPVTAFEVPEPRRKR